jgi:hypothetical protein
VVGDGTSRKLVESTIDVLDLDAPFGLGLSNDGSHFGRLLQTRQVAALFDRGGGGTRSDIGAAPC